MRNLTFTGNLYGETITLQQIQKRTAKKMYENGETVYLQTRNFSPFGVWSQCFDVDKERSANESFDSVINAFEYYNCNSESGLYTTFYKRIK